MTDTTQVRIRSIALPTEHGGWGFTLEPILLGLLVAPTVAGWGLAVATAAVFLARRPVKLVSTDLVRRRRLPRTRVALWFALGYGALALAGLALAVANAAGPFWWPLVAAIPFRRHISAGRRSRPQPRFAPRTNRRDRHGFGRGCYCPRG